MRLIDADALKKAINDYASEPVKLKDRRWDAKCKAIIADMIGTIDDAQTVGGWISVKDRIPELEGDYLVTDGHNVPWKCRLLNLAGIKGWVNNAFNPPVKYWMPLPEPPKEETT